MYTSSEDAMDAALPVSLAVAQRELARHGCRILNAATPPAERQLRVAPGRRIQVTNDCDAPEWIGCDTRSILEWLGY